MIGPVMYWLIPLATFVLALALSIAPLDDQVAPFRPDWVALVLIFWAVTRPQHFGLLSAFVLGLALDMVSGSLLGSHALALLPIAYVALRMHRRIRAALPWQLALTVLLMLGLYHFVLFWIDGVALQAVPGLLTWAPILSSLVFWPVVIAALGGFHGNQRTKA